ncbi:hypothetical protein IMCC21224_112164 [Puniceibacterium sp. IMCC21224]|nr:hypothetical protein IMCC21224_112164 [Puniceibacterium sp. IMCC21224]
MRHNTDALRATQIKRLFALYAAHMNQQSADHPGEYRVVSPGFARDFQQRAIASLRFSPEPDQSPDPKLPRNPVATTNFSELSAREAGGFTFATLTKRCLSSF